jgi:hypothetical protein
MDLNLQVYDNFLENPDDYRKFALSQKYDIRGNYPGVRAKFTSSVYLNILNEALGKAIGQEFEHEGASTWFQACTELEEFNWIHHDTKDLAGILYLTPNAPIDYGTSIFRHIPTGKMYADQSIEDQGLHRYEDDWEEVIRVGNVYNRLVLYDGFLYHRSTKFGFGNSLENCRLTQTFFLNLGRT